MKLWLCVVVLVALTHWTEAILSDEVQSEHRIHIRGLDDVQIAPTCAADIFKPIDVEVEGEYYWERIYYIDNRGQNNPYKETRKITKTVTTSYSDLKKSVEDSCIKSSIDRPDNLITETSGGSPDINAGFRGKYVWLVPEWTSNADDAVTKIEFVKQGSRNNAYQDLAAGAGGAYRYLKFLHDSSHCRIKRVGLLRSRKANYIFGDRHKYGWDECTQDINMDRKGDWLHLCWNTVNV